MDDSSARNPVAATSADPSATPAHQAVLDANGFDPTDFEWRPVPRRRRADGWTPEAQQRFIEALARTGIVERACQEVDLSVRSAYNLRNAKGGESFARAWTAALTRAADRVLDIAFEQAIEGEEVPIFDRDGVRTGSTRRYNTRMAMNLLRAYHPERFRHAHRDTRAADEPLPPPAEPLPTITATLAPVTPADPAALATPERLDDMIYTAQALANADEAYPPDDSEDYSFPEREEQHPKVLHRARINRARRARREDAAAERDARAKREERDADEDVAALSYVDDAVHEDDDFDET